MGYNTTFIGHFLLNKTLRPEQKAYLQRFSEIYHVALDEKKLQAYDDPLREIVGLPIGKNGMYFTGMIPDETDVSKIAPPQLKDMSIGNIYNVLQAQQEREFIFPSHWCQWVPTRDGKGIEWDGGEKFYNYEEWLHFLIDHFLIPWGYELSGTVSFEGEQGEHGRIIVTCNEIKTVIDGDSIKPRTQEDSGIDEVIKIYWMTVGAISERARKALMDANVIIKELSSEPPIILLGFPYDINYYKRHGHDDLAIWRGDGISLASKKLHLDWADNQVKDPSWEGVPTQKLILGDEPDESWHSPFESISD